jgi:hypothetical protein
MAETAGHHLFQRVLPECNAPPARKNARDDMMRVLAYAPIVAASILGNAAMAEGTIKIAFIDPLSGGGASVRRARPKELSVRGKVSERERRYRRSLTSEGGAQNAKGRPGVTPDGFSSDCRLLGLLRFHRDDLMLRRFG